MSTKLKMDTVPYVPAAKREQDRRNGQATRNRNRNGRCGLVPDPTAKFGYRIVVKASADPAAIAASVEVLKHQGDYVRLTNPVGKQKANQPKASADNSSDTTKISAPSGRRK